VAPREIGVEVERLSELRDGLVVPAARKQQTSLYDTDLA
jgi:hypothetical protein